MNPSAPEKNLRLLMFITFYSFITIGVAPGVLNIAWTYIQAEFGLPLSALGVLLGAATVGRLLTSFLSGAVINRFGIGLFLLMGSVFGFLGELGYAIAPAWWVLLVAAFIAAMGAGIIDAGMNTFVSTYYGKGPMNWMHAFFGVGLTIGPFIVTMIVSNFEQSWRWAYIVVASFQIIFGLSMILTLKHWRMPPIHQEDEDTARGEITKAATIGQTLAVPAVIMGIVLFIIYGGVEVGAGQLSNTLFTESRGVGQQQASFWISVYWASFTIGRMIVGSIGDIISNNRLMRLSILATVLGAFLLWANFTNLVGFIGLAILGFGLAPMFATLIAETPRRVGRRHVANAIGFQIGFAGFGGALLPGIAGVLAENISLEVIGLFLFVNAIAVWVLYEYILLRESRAAPILTTGDEHSTA